MNKKIIALVLLPLLSGCNALTGEGYKLSDDSRVNHPINVSATERTLDVWNDGRGKLVADISEIRNFSIEYSRRGHGPVILEGRPAAVNGVAAVLYQNGVNSSDIRILPNPELLNHVHLSYRVYQAKVAGCGKFKSDSYPLFSNFWNNTNSEFGCSTQNNLSAMISDPLDLVHQHSTMEPSRANSVGRVLDTQNYITPPAPEKQSAGR